MKKKDSGFTLIELVVAVLITAILARVGFDNYRKYIMRANRAVARTALMSLAAKQEVQALQNPASGYATTFAPLNGVSASPPAFYIDQNGAVVSSAATSIYQVSFASSPTPSATAYALQAVAQGIQAQRDTACKTLILNGNGIKQAQNSSGTTVSDPNTCWEK